VLAEYRLAPEVTRKRLLIEALEDILMSSGRIVVADNSGDVIKLLNLDGLQTDDASAVVAVEGGGN
jgi:membrane protease subunit HflK